ncbi:serine protease, S1-C subfamily, contains C-terminal PDZ domain [Verrucomicrobium sp. GAS474]|uniref:S1C family serine protease n=1 Tax=Verrucomicrobium sp. GAS474 TaxID=1882831 RepID=UPI00087ADA40|nr:S1C family serine protease [Verrucomicrobium sp. GAS474]SDU02065.1 serine protease, S1-C subfamily, contains C-terminal PDZ domain [Verrucomicrobium sp. GAS474]
MVRDTRFLSLSFGSAFSLLVLASASLGLGTLPARAESAFDAIGTQVNKVFENGKASVVRVHAAQAPLPGTTDSFETIGSGFFIDNKGTLVTAASIIGFSPAVSVEVGGLRLPAKILGLDPRSGVAVLQVFDGITPFLTFGKEEDVHTATPIVAIGFPLNLPSAPSFGMVTGFDTQYLGRFFSCTHLRTSLPISPGQIGGPVLDGRGGVVGMLIMAADERKFAYALPASAIQKIVTDIAVHGRVEYGWIGVGVDPRSDSNDVKITQLFESTPASTSGLQPGDTVVRIGPREIAKASDVIDASFYSEVGDDLAVVVNRKGKLLTYKFTVGERPSRLPVPIPAIVPTSPADVPQQAIPVRADLPR